MTCKNCKTELTTESDFCNHCGAKVIRNRLTIKNLFEHFSEQFLNYDNKFFQTIIYLFKKPEDVIGSYVSGTRKKYVNPISFFAISLSISGIYMFFFQKYLTESFNMSDFYKYENQQKITEAMMSFTIEYNSLIYFVIIPALALISLVVFYNKKFNFTEHVIIYLYSMSLFSFLSILLTIFILLVFPSKYLFLSGFIYAFMFIYHAYILKRIFQLSAKQILIKTIIFIPLFFIFYLISSVLMVILVLLTGEISLQDLVPKR